MNKQQFDQFVRMAAMEYVVTHVAKVAFLAAGGPDMAVGLVQEQRRGASRKLEQQTLVGVEPALADHFVAELQSEVDRLLSGIEETLAKTLNN